MNMLPAEFSPMSLYSNNYNNTYLTYPIKHVKNYDSKKYYTNNNTNHNNSSSSHKHSRSPTTYNSGMAAALNAACVDKFNPAQFYFNGEQENERSSRFFVIKSYSKEDVVHSIKNNIWCSTENGNSKLDEAFKRTVNQKHASIYLFFSVNGSGQFCGMAEMVSSVDYKSSSQLWTQNKWKGKFDVKWLYVKNVPNPVLRQIHLPNNENKSVTNSRDTQEILYEQATQVMDVFRKYEHANTILDEAAAAGTALVVDPFAAPIAFFGRKEYDAKKSNEKYALYAPVAVPVVAGEQVYRKVASKSDKTKAHSQHKAAPHATTSTNTNANTNELLATPPPPAPPSMAQQQQPEDTAAEKWIYKSNQCPNQ